MESGESALYKVYYSNNLESRLFINLFGIPRGVVVYYTVNEYLISDAGLTKAGVKISNNI